jgi:hypothetical protein
MNGGTLISFEITHIGYIENLQKVMDIRVNGVNVISPL